jgi:hypothetical protein
MSGDSEHAVRHHAWVVDDGLNRKAKPILVIDGSRFHDFAGFVSEFSALLEDFEWNGSLDAFNDILRGGCGTPEDGGFVLRWLHSHRSRSALGYEAKAEWLSGILQTCHESNRGSVRDRLAEAQRRHGPTLFDDLLEIIRYHGSGGPEAEDDVELELL